MQKTVMNDTTKNLLALSIALGGLFIGSLFVDIGQLIIGRGFSQHAINDHEVLEQNDRTWVSYADPKVALTVLTDTACAACNTDESLLWLRRVIPTLSVSVVESGSNAGQALAEQHGILSVPAFIFGESIQETAFYAQATPLFRESGQSFLLDMEGLGLPAGKYLHVPALDDRSIVLGQKDAPLKVVLYSDFQCNYCGGFHKNQMKKLLDEYGNRAAFVFKAFPLEAHPKSPLLAAAAFCAYEQGKYFEYASALFGKQRDLERRPNTKQELKNIAWMGRLDWKPFSDCIDQDRYQDQVRSEGEEARSLGLDAAPALFIGDRFFSGAVEYDLLRAAMETALTPEN